MFHALNVGKSFLGTREGISLLKLNEKVIADLFLFKGIDDFVVATDEKKKKEKRTRVSGELS